MPDERDGILCQWVVDLLDHDGTRCRRYIPVRDYLNGESKTMPAFPDVTAMETLLARLQQDEGYLRFLTHLSRHPVPEKSSPREDACSVTGAFGLTRVLESIRERREKLDRMETFDAHVGDNGTVPPHAVQDPAAKLPTYHFYVLRDYGSYSPILPDDRRPGEGCGRGGGYFLRFWPEGSGPDAPKYGIVIDPGFDYVRNFYEAHLEADQITDVVVTHDHYDHCASFGPLLNLLYARHRKIGGRKIRFHLCRGTYDQFARYIFDTDVYHSIQPLSETDPDRRRTHTLCDEVSLMPLPTCHGDERGFGMGCGFVLGFGRGLPTLGITSDTGWYGPPKRKKDLAEHLTDHRIDILVAHVGSFTEKELRDSGAYATHLGMRGVYRCVERLTSCNVVLLSEFGEECLGYRRWFAEALTDFVTKGSPGRPGRCAFRCFASDRHTVLEANSADPPAIRMLTDSGFRDYANARCTDENPQGLTWT